MIQIKRRQQSRACSRRFRQDRSRRAAPAL